MRHQEASRLLPRLAAGELDERRTRRVQGHVTGCDECRSWLDAYALMAESLGEVAAAEPHPSSNRLARLAVDAALLDEAELDALHRHLESCGRCSDELRRAGDSLARAGRLDAAGARPAPGGRTPRAAALGAALAAALALAVGLAFVLPRAPAAPEAPLERAAAAAAPEPQTGSRAAVQDPATGPAAPAAAAAERRFSGRVARGVHLIESPGLLTTSGLSLADGAEVTLRAGDAVVLGDGLAVGDGARLKIENFADSGDGGSDDESA